MKVMTLKAIQKYIKRTDKKNYQGWFVSNDGKYTIINGMSAIQIYPDNVSNEIFEFTKSEFTDNNQLKVDKLFQDKDDVKKLNSLVVDLKQLEIEVKTRKLADNHLTRTCCMYHDYYKQLLNDITAKYGNCYLNVELLLDTAKCIDDKVVTLYYPERRNQPVYIYGTYGKGIVLPVIRNNY